MDSLEFSLRLREAMQAAGFRPVPIKFAYDRRQAEPEIKYVAGHSPTGFSDDLKPAHILIVTKP